MKFMSSMKIVLCTYLVTLSSVVSASTFTDWTEDPTDPIYNPFPTTALQEDYFPCVVYDENQFNGDGAVAYYKMWHQGDNGTIALSCSDDGKNWTFIGQTNLPENAAFHPCVVYDKDGFKKNDDHYRIWYWTGVVGKTPDVIQFTESKDGLTWKPPVPIIQSTSHPLVDGITPGYFYHLYGPGFVHYNANAVPKPGKPDTFPYVMFYDTSSEGFGPGISVEQIALAYSTDGKNWARYGSTPVLIPSGGDTDWDGTHMYRPSIIFKDGTYHMFYSGSNDVLPGGVVYAHGLGHATSSNLVTWKIDPSNPIFYYQQDASWRNGRVYTPFVLPGSCNAINPREHLFKMWFTGGTGTTAGIDQGIGYATIPCCKIENNQDDCTYCYKK